jgi:putative membrane protein
MNHPFVNLLVRWLVLALGVALSTKLAPGISYDSGLTLFLVVVVLSFLNVVVKPLLLLFTLPFIILTLGLGIWIVNACLLYLVGRGLISGFHVASFGSALIGSLIISITNLVMNRLIIPPPKPPAPRPPSGGKRDDVIDI